MPLVPVVDGYGWFPSVCPSCRLIRAPKQTTIEEEDAWPGVSKSPILWHAFSRPCSCVLESRVVNATMTVWLSPIGPALMLLVGAAVELVAGRWVRRPDWLTGLALFFAGLAALLFVALQFQSVVPTLGLPWQPLLQVSTNLYWISDGWNYYISGLILLLGTLGILLDRPSSHSDGMPRGRLNTVLAMNLVVLASSLMFVNSGNLLTALLTWVLLDLAILLRTAVEPLSVSADQQGARLRTNEARILSLLGALLLLIGLLPAGPGGPAQELATGSVPTETLVLMLLAASIRAGIYPFHIWLLPRTRTTLNLAERLLDHMTPVLCGLWLFGWAFRMGGAELMNTPPVLGVLALTLLFSALAAWTAADQLHHVTFVLITSAGVAVLAGALSHNPGPAGMIWATTAFALGGGLWLVGDQVWRAWGWQLPVSVGALALAGVPFTPGFMAQASISSLLTSGIAYLPVFAIYVLAQGILIAALLHSWSGQENTARTSQPQSYMVRLLAASLALGLPLAVSGVLPYFTETITGIPHTIPPGLGNPPSAVAGLTVWITIGLPLLLGFGLVWSRPRIWPKLRTWPNSASQISQLEWAFQVSMWGIDRIAQLGNNALHVVEGAGHLGWFLVFLLIAFLLIQ